MIVADASLIVHFLIGVNGPDAAAIVARAELIAAPALLDFEVVSGIRRLVLSKKSTDERAKLAIASFYRLRIERYFMEPFVGRIWTLKANATAYDASYIALAERLAAPLYTLDRRLASVPGHGASVIAL